MKNLGKKTTLTKRKINLPGAEGTHEKKQWMEPEPADAKIQKSLSWRDGSAKHIGTRPGVFRFNLWGK